MDGSRVNVVHVQPAGTLMVKAYNPGPDTGVMKGVSVAWQEPAVPRSMRTSLDGTPTPHARSPRTRM